VRALARHLQSHHSMSVDDEGSPLHRKQSSDNPPLRRMRSAPLQISATPESRHPITPAHTELFRDRCVRVRKQRVVEGALHCEMALSVCGVGAYPDALSAQGREGCPQITKVTSLGRADRTRGGGIEEQNHRAIGHHVTERPDVPFVIRKSKIRRDIASTHGGQGTRQALASSNTAFNALTESPSNPSASRYPSNDPYIESTVSKPLR